jgi:hypothetical protein
MYHNFYHAEAKDLPARSKKLDATPFTANPMLESTFTFGIWE